MQIRFLGTGGAFDFEYGNSAAWVEINGFAVLVDCGYSIYTRLRELDLMDRIDYILLTHMHDDHVGSLSTAILHHKHLREPSSPAKILYPPTPAGERFLQQIRSYLSFSLGDPDRYVNFLPLTEAPGIGFLETTGMHVPDMLSFAYSFDNEHEIVLYSGDMGDPDMIFEWAEHMDPAKRLRIFHEMSFQKFEGIHSYYKDLMPRLSQYELYAYHLDPREEPEDNAVPLVAEHAEFLFP